MTPTALTRSDAALMSAARTDPDAFRELYGRYDERVHGYFVRRTRDDAAALDLTAETFAQAWLVRARFRDEAGGSAAPWLFGIARNALLMSVRRGAIERRATERLGLMGRLDHAPGRRCRSLNAAGTHWRCYIGQEAVRRQIIGAGFLGQYAPAPGVG